MTDGAFINEKLKSALFDWAGPLPCRGSEGADVSWRQNVLLPGDTILHNAD